MTENEPPSGQPLRPRDFALLLLASGDLRPRQRARDQRADAAGLMLKRRLLDGLVALDPEAAELESALLVLVEELGLPSGPARAVAANVWEEWRAARANPAWLSLLLSEGLSHVHLEIPRAKPVSPEAARPPASPAS